jgi:hypothetical protein
VVTFCAGCVADLARYDPHAAHFPIHLEAIEDHDGVGAHPLSRTIYQIALPKVATSLLQALM